MQIYPSILVDDFQEFERRIHLVENEASLFHIDVGDGVFVPHKSFDEIGAIASFAWKTPFELHLMLKNPDESILPWLEVPAKRIIFHWEAKQGTHTWVRNLIKRIKDLGKEVGIALNPMTSQEDIYAFLRDIDLIHIMSVEPGFSGAEFLPEVLPKIVALRERKFSGIIEVDGGMNEETISRAQEAGANAVAVASAIFNADDPKQALLHLSSKFKA